MAQLAADTPTVQSPAAPGRPTIADRFQGRGNNFDAIRLIGAFMVLFTHCFLLTGRRGDPLELLLHHESLGSSALAAFFIMSGFLITASYDSDPNPGRFLLRRVLRIHPALLANVAFCILVIGPLCTALSQAQYWSAGRTWDFFATATAWKVRYELPGVFQDLPNKALNGSLWTLRSEFNLYFLLLGLGLLKLLRPWVVIGGIVAALVLQWHVIKLGWWNNVTVMQIPVQFQATHLFYFLSGTLFYQWRKHIRLDWRWLALCVLAAGASAWLSWGVILYRMALPYAVLYVALTPLPVLPKLRQFGDFSYGAYLYAFPIQQAVLHWFGVNLSLAMFMAVSTVLTFALAIASWYLIEHPALSLRHYIDGNRAKTPRPVQGGAKFTDTGQP